VLWWLALLAGSVLVMWKQSGKRWGVVLVMWFAHVVWIDSAWISRRERMRLEDPYCCVLAGFEGVVAMSAIVWPVFGACIEPIGRRIRRAFE